MFQLITAIFVLAIFAVLVYAATRPDTFRVQRAVRIKAPPESLFSLINDLRNFNLWNPYAKKDPDLKGSYGGVASGVGATYAFAGNKEVGKGSIEITDSAPPSKVSMNLDMIDPFEAHNLIEFTLEPQGDATSVTWAMQGRLNYLAKIVHLVFNMDRMIGKDFEAGLAGLKHIAEK